MSIHEQLDNCISALAALPNDGSATWIALQNILREVRSQRPPYTVATERASLAVARYPEGFVIIEARLSENGQRSCRDVKISERTISMGQADVVAWELEKVAVDLVRSFPQTQCAQWLGSLMRRT